MEAVNWVDANDVYSYLKISEAAPGFPKETIPFHFAQRFIPHYTVGLLSHFTSISIASAYALLNALIVGLIIWLSTRMLVKKFKGERLALLTLVLLVVSPFSFRLNILVPGLLSDMTFVMGLALALNGILDKSFFKVFLGMLVACCGKQMSLLILPGMLLYSFIAFKDLHGKVKTLIACLFLGVFVVMINRWLAYFSSEFAAANSITGKILFAIVPWIVSDKFSLAQLMEHFFRIFLPSLPFLGLLFVFGTKQKDKIIILENLALLLMVLGPASYSFLPGPVVQMGNQSRYVASAMLPMILFTANLLPSLNLKLQKVDVIVLGIIIVLFSYNHRYCIFPSTPTLFITIHLLSIIMLLGWLCLRKKVLISPLDQ